MAELLDRLYAAIGYLVHFLPPRREVTHALIDGYVTELGDLPIEAVEAAVREIVRTARFFPAVAEVRAAAVARTLGLPTEAEALQQVERYVTAVARRSRLECPACGGQGQGCPECGGTGEVWDEPLPALHASVKAALDLVGGYRGFTAAEEPTVVRGQFLRLYRSTAGEATRQHAVGELPASPAGLQLPGGTVLPALRRPSDA